MNIPIGPVFAFIRALFQTLEKGYSAIDRAIVKLWEWMLSQLYEIIPTLQGEIGSDLTEAIDSGTLYIGVRVRTFNNSVGKFIRLSFVLTSFLFFITLVIMFPLIILPEIIPDTVSSFIPDTLPNLLLFGSLLIFGLILLTSMASLAFSDILLSLYLLAVIRFGVQRIKKSLQIESEVSDDFYTFKVSKLSNSKGTPREDKIYQNNIASIFRANVYILLVVILVAVGVALPTIARSLNEYRAFIPDDLLGDVPILSFLERLTTVADSLIPIGIEQLLNPDNASLVLFLIAALFFFAVFLNCKQVAQHAIRSQFSWSQFDEFRWRGEINRYRTVMKIILHKLLEGDLRNRYEIIRGQILLLILYLFATALLHVFYIYVILNSI